MYSRNEKNQAPASSSFPLWPGSWLYLATSSCILPKGNPKNMDYVLFDCQNSESDSPAFPRLGLAYFSEKGFAKDRLLLDTDEE